MDKFTASNGAQFEKTPQGGVTFLGGIDDHLMILGPAMTSGLREFFLAEHDEELGRWRWPEKPEYVVYPSALYSHPANPDRVKVVNEQNGQSHRADRDDPDEIFGFFSEAGHAYFEAHPERKPWHDAKPGEVWSVVPNGNAWVLESGAFMFDDESFLFAKDIRDARRIWPEDAS